MIQNEMLDETTTPDPPSDIQARSGGTGRPLYHGGTQFGREGCRDRGLAAPVGRQHWPALPGNGKHAAEPPRIHELGTENRRRRMEQAPLKKATAFVGKQSP